MLVIETRKIVKSVGIAQLIIYYFAFFLFAEQIVQLKYEDTEHVILGIESRWGAIREWKTFAVLTLRVTAGTTDGVLSPTLPSNQQTMGSITGE